MNTIKEAIRSMQLRQAQNDARWLGQSLVDNNYDEQTLLSYRQCTNLTLLWLCRYFWLKPKSTVNKTTMMEMLLAYCRSHRK